MKTLFRTLIIFSLTLAIPIASVAGIYKYRDANGRLNFVDDESRIPAEFRKDKTSISGSQETLTVYTTKDDKKESTPPPLVETEVADTTATKKKIREHQTPVVVKGNRVLVPVEFAIGNRVVKLSLLLDTGATSTVLHRQSLTKLELPAGKKFMAQIAGGGTVSSERVKFRHIKVGPFRIKKTSAMVIDFKGRNQGFDGMLGMDFLKGHPYQVDYQKSVINWGPED